MTDGIQRGEAATHSSADFCIKSQGGLKENRLIGEEQVGKTRGRRLALYRRSRGVGTCFEPGQNQKVARLGRGRDTVASGERQSWEGGRKEN